MPLEYSWNDHADKTTGEHQSGSIYLDKHTTHRIISNQGKVKGKCRNTAINLFLKYTEMKTTN